MNDHIPNDDTSASGGGGHTENVNGLRAFETLGEFLESDGWHPQRLDNRYVYRTHFVGKAGEYRCLVQVRVDLEQFIFYAVGPIRVPEDDRVAVAEFLTRANFGLRIGNFEMDFGDGEIRYKTSLDFEGEPLTPTLIRNTIYPAVLTLDRYMPGLGGVIYGGMTPFEAIEHIETND